MADTWALTRWQRSLLAHVGLALLVGAACSDSPGRQGEPCNLSDQMCAEGLICYAARCQTKAFVDRHMAPLLKKKREAEAAQAKPVPDGGPAVQTDQPQTPAPGRAPSSVRVVRNKSKSPLFAACRPEERLVGGGCRALSKKAMLSASYPSHQRGDDTLGGRWNCEVQSHQAHAAIEAYALCQQPGPAAKQAPAAKRRRRRRRRTAPRLIRVYP